MANIKFISGTSSQYAAITTKDDNALYFLTDTQQIYKGNTLMADATDSDLNSIVVKDTYANWLEKEKTYVPAAGLICIYEDRSQVGGINVPDIKIGDGTSTLEALSFYSDRITDSAMTVCGISELGTGDNKYLFFDGVAKKVEHALTIGTKSYDGSANVDIPVYAGE